MTRERKPNLVTAAALALSAMASCGGEGGHPPPIGDAGSGHLPPIIVEFGGTSNAGSGGQGPGPMAGSQAFAGSADSGGSSAAFAGASSFAASAGDTAIGGRFDVGGNDAFGGAFSSGGSISVSGSFSTGGI